MTGMMNLNPLEVRVVLLLEVQAVLLLEVQAVLLLEAQVVALQVAHLVAPVVLRRAQVALRRKVQVVRQNVAALHSDSVKQDCQSIYGKKNCKSQVDFSSMVFDCLRKFGA